MIYIMVAKFFNTKGDEDQFVLLTNADSLEKCSEQCQSVYDLMTQVSATEIISVQPISFAFDL